MSIAPCRGAGATGGSCPLLCHALGEYEARGALIE